MKLTQERVKELFDYHEDGYLIRKTSGKGKGHYIGNIAGTLNKKNGYLYVRVDGFQCLLHRIIFLWHHGYLPENDIDHIDRNKLNNRVENYREVSRSCNMRNKNERFDNTSGVTGVGLYSPTQKWRSYIQIFGKILWLGHFNSFDNAVKARWKKEVELNWDGCNSTSSAFLYLKERNILPVLKIRRSV